MSTDNDSIDVVEFFNTHDVRGKIKEKDNLYIECPDCSKENLSVELTSGAWHCWSSDCKLNAGGNFKELVSKLNLQADVSTISFRKKDISKKDKKLTQDDLHALECFKANKAEVIQWAVSRSIDPELALKSGIGYDTQQRAVVYSFNDENGKLIGYKCKSDHGQWIIGKEPKLYVIDPSDLKKEKVILVEGEADVLTLKGMGLPAVASLGSTKEKGFELLATMKRIFIGYDMDPSGQAGSLAAAEKLGLFKCRKLEWEAKDVNDWVQQGATKENILDALSKAAKYIEGSNILSAKDAVTDYFDQQDAGPKKRYSWGWSKLDVLTKGWSGGELLGVQAESNTGKTTFLLNAVTNIAMQEINCAIVSLEEHPIYEITPKLLSCAIGKNISTYKLGRDATNDDADKILERIKIYKDKPDLKKVADFIRECYYNHDVRCAAVDYFQLLVDDEESVQNIKETIWVFKNLTIELPDLMIPLIIQPKQVDQPQDDDRNKDGSKKRKKKLGGWSMRGGAAINQTLDKALMISAVRDHGNVTQYEYTKCRGHLDVSKNDWLGRQMQLDYDHDTMLMTQREQLIYDL